jgi:hypothetical protein
MVVTARRPGLSRKRESTDIIGHGLFSQLAGFGGSTIVRSLYVRRQSAHD